MPVSWVFVDQAGWKMPVLVITNRLGLACKIEKAEENAKLK